MIADFAGDQAAPADYAALFEFWIDRIGWSVDMHELGYWGGTNLEFYQAYAKADPQAFDFSGLSELMKKTMATQREIPPRFEECRRRIYRACAHRALFVTARGYMGLAPWNAQVGDTVAVLDGGKTPFLLREASGLAHTLVGEAFVYGIMGGEGLEWEHARGLARRTFHLV